MNLIKVTQVQRGEPIKTWINVDKIIYIQPYDHHRDPAYLPRSIMLVEDVGSALFLVETCDEILGKIELEFNKPI